MLSQSSSFIKYLTTNYLNSVDFDFISSAISYLASVIPNNNVVVIRHEYSPECFQVDNTDTWGVKLKKTLESARINEFILKNTYYEFNEFGIIPLEDFAKHINYLLVIPLTQANKSKDLFVYCTQIQDVYKIITLNKAYDAMREQEQSARLMSQISHDINSLLSQIPEENLQNERFKAKVEYTDKIASEIVYYLRELRVDMIRVSVTELFESIVRGFYFPENIDFDLKFVGQFDFCVVDVELIDRALHSILTNAVFAADIAGGKVGVTITKTKNKSPFIYNDWLQIFVEDSGPGIPDEFLAEVKKPFFTTWKDFGHPGLGLPITEKIITAHKGKLSLQNKPNGGLKVTISLPINNGNSKE